MIVNQFLNRTLLFPPHLPPNTNHRLLVSSVQYGPESLLGNLHSAYHLRSLLSFLLLLEQLFLASNVSLSDDLTTGERERSCGGLTLPFPLSRTSLR
jgi:hypothetical protein